MNSSPLHSTLAQVMENSPSLCTGLLSAAPNTQRTTGAPRKWHCREKLQGQGHLGNLPPLRAHSPLPARPHQSSHGFPHQNLPQLLKGSRKEHLPSPQECPPLGTVTSCPGILSQLGFSLLLPLLGCSPRASPPRAPHPPPLALGPSPQGLLPLLCPGEPCLGCCR